MTARASTRAIVALVALPLGLFAVTIVGVVVAISGAGLGCHGSTPSRTGAADEIPAARLRIYRAAAQRFDIDWAFLASIGAQECHHGSCAGDNGSGCAGPMQIAVRRGSPCSPGSGPTLWERFGVDGDHDGRTDPDDPADAVFTAARILREVEHAPPTGGTYDQYHRAACGYYGACGDATADYADQVMARAVAYGFGEAQADASGGGCGSGPAAALPASGDQPANVERDRSPGGLELLPAVVTNDVSIKCDRRMVADVVWIAHRFRVRVTACFAIHATGGEHPLGAAVDVVPATGRSWTRTTERLARALGWKRSCAASGVAPACARSPFRFIGYDGYPGHGDPSHCRCDGAAHLHLSWLTSASDGQPQHAQRGAYFAPDWIDVFTNTTTNSTEDQP